jgi:hypothetical protein
VVAALVGAALLCLIAAPYMGLLPRSLAAESAVDMALVGQLDPGQLPTAPYSITYAVAFDDNGWYLGMGDQLVVLDPGRTWPPRELGRTESFPDRVRAIAGGSGYAYVAAGDAGLRVVDVRVGAKPAETAWLETPGQARGVAVAGDVAVVAGGPAGLVIVDVSDPSNPAELATLNLNADANAVAVVASTAWVAAGTLGLASVDISVPEAPQLQGSGVTPGAALSLAVGLGEVAVGDDSGNVVGFRTSNPASPVRLYTVSGTTPVLAVAMNRDTLVAAHGDRGIVSYNATRGSRPTRDWFSDTPGIAQGLVLREEAVYVADGRAGLHYFIGGRSGGVYGAVDQAGPSQPDQEVSGIAKAGDYVYVGSGSTGMRVINVSSPAAPVEVGLVPNGGWITGITVDADGAVTAAFGRGVIEYDISNPEAPRQLEHYNLPSKAVHAVRGDDLIYVAAGSDGLWFVGNGSPTGLSVKLPGWSSAVAVSDGYAYVAAGSRGLHVVGLSGTEARKLLGSTSSEGWSGDVEVRDGLAYVADGSRGLCIVDVSVPTLPREIGRIETPYDASDVELYGDIAFVADNRGGLWAFDVAEPTRPKAAGHIDIGSGIRNIVVSDTHVYAADAVTGLSIIAFEVGQAPIPTATESGGVTASPPPTASAATPPTATATPQSPTFDRIVLPIAYR